MKNIFIYLKYLGLFFLFIIGISLFTSIINLTNINSTLISKIGIILTAISFFIISTLASNNSHEKGFILGAKLGITFIISLILINLILFRTKFTIDRFIYYTILLFSSILGGSFGKNFKLKKFSRKNS